MGCWNWRRWGVGSALMSFDVGDELRRDVLVEAVEA